MNAPKRRHNEVEMPRLRTCQTCFHAKIKCVKTQDSDVCDRCLRLDKECVFAQSKRRVVPRTGAQRLASAAQESSRSPVSLTSSNHNTHPSHRALEGRIADASACCPLSTGILSAEAAQTLLDSFSSRMNPHFPFVLVPSIPIETLNCQKPAVCLAVLAVASFDNATTQQMLGELFNKLIAFRVMDGNFASLELLQGLLIFLAWAQYQPRPRRYSQHLGLAVSIISDLRMDRPKNTKLWGLDSKNEHSVHDWTPDEVRAVAGTYYLASSASILLQKSRSFGYRPYYLRRCEALSALQLEPSDKYLSLIIRMQRIIEAIGDTMAGEAESSYLPPPGLRIEELANELTTVKAAISFPLSENRILSLQVHIAELLLGQSRPGESLFGLDKLQEGRIYHDNPHEFLAWLSGSIFAVKSIVNISLALPVGDEVLITNMEWIALYCGLSLATRLDIVATHPNICQETKQLRQFTDMAHVLRQTILRLESASVSITDPSGENNVFLHLAKRAKFLEDWYLGRLAQYATTTSRINSSATRDYAPTLDPNMGFLDTETSSGTNGHRISDTLTSLQAEYDFGTFTFALPGPFDL